MKLVIEIPEETYDEVRHYGLNLCPRDKEALEKAFKTCKPLPKGHGELKDINALKQKLMIWDYKVNAIPNYAWKCIEDAPTIIESNRGEEG